MGPRRVKKTNRLAVVVSAAIYGGSALLVGAGCYFGTSWLLRPKPIAAIGLTVCGKVQAVTIIMSNGKMKRFDGPSKEGAALIRKVPVENFADYAVRSAACSPPKVY